MRRHLWLILGWIWLILGPSSPLTRNVIANCPLTAQGGTCAVFASPKIANNPGDFITFTFTMSTGSTTHFVLTQENNGVTLITLGSNQTQVSLQYIAAGVATYRLHPKSWCKGFTRSKYSDADALRNAVQGEINALQSLFSSHGQLRSIIETLEHNLITAIEYDEPATIDSIKTQLNTLEQNDDNTLQQIKARQDAIDLAYGEPFRDDAGIVELNLLAFQVNDSYEPVSPDPSIPPDTRRYAVIEDDQEETQGLEAWLNDDDDNENTTPDKEESPVTNENDLAIQWWLLAKPLEAPRGIWNWNLEIETDTSTADISFWDSPNKSQSQSLPKTVMDNYARDSIYIEALNPSPTNLSDVFRASIGADPVCRDEIRTTRLAIVSVDFEEGPAGSANFESTENGPSFAIITDPPTPVIQGGERRLFPCKNSPEDILHSVVSVRVEVTPQRPLVSVWIRSFDVDDPSSFGPADDIQGGEVLKNDNRLTVGGSGRHAGLPMTTSMVPADSIGRVSDKTLGNGLAYFKFDVRDAMQPGNNFRMVAGFGKSAVTDRIVVPYHEPTAKVFSTPDPTGEKLPEKGEAASFRKQSPLLTIWRRIHVERDSMNGRVNYYAKGTVRSISRPTGTFVHVRHVVNGTIQGGDGRLDSTGRNGRFENGKMIIRALNDSLPVEKNSPTIVKLKFGASSDWEGKEFELYDDDMIEAFPLPDMSLLQESHILSLNLLAAAYVEPVLDGGGNHNNDQEGELPFVMNVENTNAALLTVINAGRKSHIDNSFDFWVGYFQTAYQKDMKSDMDSDDEFMHGTSLGTTPDPGQEQSTGSLIWLENINDLYRYYVRLGGQRDFDLMIRQTSVHEFGHQLTCDHGEDGILGNRNGVVLGYGENPKIYYSERSLGKIRSLEKPRRTAP